MKTCPFCKGLNGDGRIVCSKCGRDMTAPIGWTDIVLRTIDEKQELRLKENSLMIKQHGNTTEIPLTQIISVSITKEPSGKFFPGTIDIRIAGSPTEIVHLAPFLSVGNGNCIRFSHDVAYQRQAYELQKHIVNYHAKPVPNVSPVSATTLSPADEIRRYKELLDMGAITQEEFDQKKKQLLGL